jgi:glycosyltransferase involved in cell wall biosynthesis
LCYQGAIAAPDELNRLYAEAHVIVLASTFEGFPMVIMEAMAHGVVPVSTSVGGIPFHVEHGINGLLIKDEDEDKIVQSIVNEIKRLTDDHALLEKMSRRAYEHARTHFTPARFQMAYRRLLLEQRGKLNSE